MQRIRQLDGIRAVAILAVFIHHSLHVKLLWMGVDLFFVLSGFLITGILLDAKNHSLGGYFAHFYSRRVRRILIPYLILLLLGSLVFGIAWMRHWYLYIFLTNFLAPLHIPHPVAFDPLWSLAVEEQFYLVWPFAVYFLCERNLRRLCILLLIAAPALRGTFHFEHHWQVYMLTPFRMDLLAVGSLLCIEWRRRPAAIERWGTVGGLALAGIGIAAMLTAMKLGFSTYANTRFGNVVIYEACLFIALGSVVYALAGRGVGWLRWRPVTYIGQISYSMYLVHLAIILLVGERIGGIAGAAIALTLTVTYAATSWILIEGPLLARKRPRATPKGQTPAVIQDQQPVVRD